MAFTNEYLDFLMSPQGMGTSQIDAMDAQKMQQLIEQISQPAPVPPELPGAPSFQQFSSPDKARAILSTLADVLTGIGNIRGRGLVPPLPLGYQSAFLKGQEETANQRAMRGYLGEKAQYESKVKSASLQREDMIRKERNRAASDLLAERYGAMYGIQKLKNAKPGSAEERQLNSWRAIVAREYGIPGAYNMDDEQLLDVMANNQPRLTPMQKFQQMMAEQGIDLRIEDRKYRRGVMGKLQNQHKDVIREIQTLEREKSRQSALSVNPTKDPLVQRIQEQIDDKKTILALVERQMAFGGMIPAGYEDQLTPDKPFPQGSAKPPVPTIAPGEAKALPPPKASYNSLNEVYADLENKGYKKADAAGVRVLVNGVWHTLLPKAQ